jgi:hypothetical protein
MNKFRIGNVVKTVYDNIEIVVGEDGEGYRTIPINYENSSCYHKAKDYERSETCYCCEANDGEYDENCEDCKGTGGYMVKVKGFDKSKLLATTVKEYILKGLTKNFEF